MLKIRAADNKSAYDLLTKGSQTFEITPDQAKQLKEIYEKIGDIEDGFGRIEHTEDYKQLVNPVTTDVFIDLINNDVLPIARSYEILNAIQEVSKWAKTTKFTTPIKDVLPNEIAGLLQNLIETQGSLITNVDKIAPKVNFMEKKLKILDEKINYGILAKFQNTLIDLLHETAALQNEVKQLEQTILTTYFPLRRRGDWFMQSVLGYENSKGEWVDYQSKDGVSLRSLNNVQWKQNLPYMQGTKSEMIAKQKELNDYFKDQEFEIDGQTYKVKTSVAKVEQETIEPFFDTDLRQTLMMFRRLNISLNESQRVALIKKLSSEHSTLRRGLRREFVLGWDDNIMRNQVEYSTANAHIAAKMRNYHRVTRAIDNNDYWYPTMGKLNSLKNKYEAFGTYTSGESEQKTAERIIAKQAYDKHRMQFKYSAKTNDANFIIDDNGKKQPTLGRGAEYKDIAVKLWDHFHSDQGSENLVDDWLNSNPIGRKLKALAVTSQLGGTLAAGLINFGTMVTHAPAVLATYNPERGFGGGFGFANSSAELIRALKDVGGAKFGKLDDLELIVENWKDKSQSEYGLTYDEASFLLRETKNGMLAAAEPRAW